MAESDDFPLSVAVQVGLETGEISLQSPEAEERKQKEQHFPVQNNWKKNLGFIFKSIPIPPIPFL